MLEDMLEYHQQPEDSRFVTAVMEGVKRQQRLRRLILTTTGIIGAAFGASGAIMLSEPIAHALGEMKLLPVSVAVLGALAFLAWVFQDETAASD